MSSYTIETLMMNLEAELANCSHELNVAQETVEEKTQQINQIEFTMEKLKKIL